MAQESWKKEIDETECQTPEGPVLCVNNCGFFGSVTTNNLCSKCYRDLVMKQPQMKMSPVIPVMDKVSSSSSSVHFEMVVESVDNKVQQHAIDVKVAEDATKQTPNRCLACCKRVGLTGFKCRCGGTFCSTHRYSEKHGCTFDYRTAGRDAIAKANPIIKADKIEKI